MTNTNIREFVELITPSISYSLGFLWGDGHLMTYKMKNHNIYYPYFSTHSKDWQEIYNTISLFNGKGGWKIRNIKPSLCVDKRYIIHKNNEGKSAILYDKKIGELLFLLDYTYKSTKSPSKVLDIIPKELHHYFWRGLIDADGCFYINNKSANYFSICSSINQDWSCAINMFKELNIKRYKINIIDTEYSKSSTLTIRNSEEIKILGNYIYKGMEDDNIGLRRKYDKFLIIEQRAKNNKIKYSAYRGVSFERGNWISYIYHNKKRYYLGTYSSEILAAKAYNLKAVELKGMNAVLNIIPL